MRVQEGTRRGGLIVAIVNLAGSVTVMTDVVEVTEVIGVTEVK